MRIVRRLVSAFLKLLATGTLSVLLAACYGVIQVMYGVPTRSGKILVKDATDGKGVPGIKVAFKTGIVPNEPSSGDWEPYPALSDAGGAIAYAVTGFDGPLYARLEDADPLADGDYAPAEVLVDRGEVTVRLWPKTSR